MGRPHNVGNQWLVIVNSPSIGPIAITRNSIKQLYYVLYKLKFEPHILIDSPTLYFA